MSILRRWVRESTTGCQRVGSTGLAGRVGEGLGRLHGQGFVYAGVSFLAFEDIGGWGHCNESLRRRAKGKRGLAGKPFSKVRTPSSRPPAVYDSRTWPNWSPRRRRGMSSFNGPHASPSLCADNQTRISNLRNRSANSSFTYGAWLNNLLFQAQVDVATLLHARHPKVAFC